MSKGVSETIQNEAKEQKGGFFGMLLGTLGASSLGTLLTVKWVKRSNFFSIPGPEQWEQEEQYPLFL